MFCLKEFSYNPDEINQYSMARVIGLGLSLMKNDLEANSINNEFIIQKFLYKEDKKENKKEDIKENKNNNESKTVNNLMDSLKDLSQVNLKIKDKAQTKTRIEDKKELPPLPN